MFITTDRLTMSDILTKILHLQTLTGNFKHMRIRDGIKAIQKRGLCNDPCFVFVNIGIKCWTNLY